MAAFGVIGLGVMGQNLALNIEGHGVPVAVWNWETDWTGRFIAAHPGQAFTGCRTLSELVGALARPRRILMMIKAGAPVDSTLESLTPILERGDVVIDGGNSWFEDTVRREARLAEVGIHFVGMGVSGGEEGARRGPCLMPGGAKPAYDTLEPVLTAIAAQTEAGPCVSYIGPGGAGHYVKMVHNGIEYGDMQLIAEAYDILRRGLGLDVTAIADTFAAWNRGVLESFLVEITEKILRVEEGGRPLVDQVLDVAGQKGTGKWTVKVAVELGVPVPTIAAAIDARLLSAWKAERVAASARLPGPGPGGSIGDRQALVAAVHDALYASKVCCYAQGLNLVRAGSEAHHWGVRLDELARIWKGGCIIRARFLDEIRAAYQRRPDLASLLVDERVAESIGRAQAGWRSAVAFAQSRGIPVPAMSASLAYVDSYRSATLPLNLTQAQRDAFGAHTYVRVDQPDGPPIHTDWLRR